MDNNKTKRTNYGNGKISDIGCGTGALTIRCAKKYEHADLTGMDYWGKE